MEPLKFVAVNEENFSDHSSVHFDELKVESNSLAFHEVDERKQELTDALKYCIDLLKEAQIILDIQNISETVSTRSKLMGREIQRRIMDMLYSVEFAEDEETLQFKEMMLSGSVEESLHSTNSEDDLKRKVNIKSVNERVSVILNQSYEYEDKDENMEFYNCKNLMETNGTRNEVSMASNKERTKQRRLSIEDRVKIIERLDNGEKVTNLAREYKISKTAIGYIRKAKEHLIRQRRSIIMCQGATSKKRCTGIENSHLEQALYKWFLQKRSIGNPVTASMLRKKALEFNKMLNGARNFKSSTGFVRRFKKRHNITCLSSGEKPSAGQDESNNFHRGFIKYITDNKIPPDKVYNADETGLNWKMLPNKIFVTSDECQASEKKVENKVTLMVCSNATGSHKLPMLVVGKENPHYVKNIVSLPVIYIRQKNAWIDRKLMLTWYQEVFIPEIKRFHGSSDDQCLLLLDNAPIHLLAEQFNSISKQCHVIYLSPNVTSLVQPMNQGIIEKLKRMYKRNFLRIMLSAETIEEVRKLSKLLDILKCCHLVSDAWDEMTEITIKNGWKNIFPFHLDMESEFDSQSFLDMVTQIPEYNNTTLEDINSWLHNDDNEQGWQILNDRELAFPENNNHEENEEEIEDSKEDLNNGNSVNDITATTAFHAINTFMSWYQSQNQCSSQDWQYLEKFSERTFDELHTSS